MLWSRSHFRMPWSPVRGENSMIIHGHTPVPLLKEYIRNNPPQENSAYWYCKNHKVDIDLGTVWTGKTVLIDLDTLEEHYFQLKEGKG